MPADRVTLFHSPNTRSTGVLTLLEELGAEYDLRLLNNKAEEQRQPAYLAINPMGKVPAILHNGELVTEQPAIYIYLADLYADAGLTPRVGERLRGPFLRWLVFHGSCFEPAIIDRFMKRDPAPRGVSPYGDFDTMFGTVSGQLEKGPYLLGDRFTAADVLWGAALGYAVGFKLVQETPAIKAYVERVVSRPAVARAQEKDAKLAASLA